VGRVSCVTASEASCPDRVQLVQQLLCEGNATAFGTAGRRLGGLGKTGAGGGGGGEGLCMTGVNGRCDCPGTGMA